MTKKRILIISIFIGVILSLTAIYFYISELKYRLYAGDSALSNQVYTKAEKDYRVGLFLNPFSSDFKGGLGLALLGQKRYVEAEKLLQEVVKKTPTDELILDGLATLCLEQRRFEEAEKYAMRIIEQNPETVYAYPHLTEVYRQRGDYKKAEEFGIEAIKNAKHFAPIPVFPREAPMKVIVDIYNETGRFEDAKKILDLMIHYTPDEPSRYFELAKTNENKKVPLPKVQSLSIIKASKMTMGLRSSRKG